MKKRKYGVFILGLSLVGTLTSCDLLNKLIIDDSNKDDQGDDETPVTPTISDELVKNAYNKLEEKVNDLYFYDEGNKGYWIIDDDTFNFIGDFDLESFTFENKDYYFDLVSSKLESGKEFNEEAKVIINKDKGTIYSELVYSGEVSSIDTLANKENYDKIFYYTTNNDGDLIANLKLSSYEVLPKYKDKLIANYKSLYGEDLYTLYRNLDFKSTFNNQEVKEIGDISSLYKEYISDSNFNITVSLEDGISLINEGAFKDFTITSEIIFPESLSVIKSFAFENATIYRLIVNDNIISFMSNSFKNALILNLGFNSYLTDNYDTFPYDDLSSDVTPYITFGTSLRKYNSISEGFSKEDVINPLGQVKVVDGVVSDENLTTIESGKTLFLAHNLVSVDNKDLIKDSIREYNNKGVSSDDISQFKNTITLKLQNDLVVYGDLLIGAIVSTPTLPNQGFISGDYASIDLNGHKLTIENGESVDSNGLIFDSLGTGTIEVKNGGVLTTNFVVNDFYGGTNTLNKYSNDESPFMLYKLPYLKTDLTVRYGGSLKAHCVLYASSSFNSTEQTIIGEKGLLEVKDENTTITLSDTSEENNFKQVIKIYGNVKTNAMSLDLGLLEVSTANVYFPVSKYLDIEVYSGSLEITNKVKLLPGSNVTFFNDSKLILSNKLFVASELPTKEDLSGINQYPDYYQDSEIAGASVKLLDNATIEINQDVETGLGGEILMESEENYESLKNIFATSNKFVSPITSTEGTGYYGTNHEYHLIESYTKEGSIALVKDDIKQESISRKENINYVSTYSDGEITNIKAIGSTNVVIGDYSENKWTINVGEEVIDVTQVGDRLESHVTDSEGNIYSYIDGTYQLVQYNEENKTYYDSENTYIGVNGTIVAGSLTERNLFHTVTDKYYFYVDDSSGWKEVNLYENGNIIARLDGSSTAVINNYVYYYDKTTNSYLESFMNFGLSSYQRHTFKTDLLTSCAFDIDNNVIKINGYPDNTTYQVTNKENGKKYVYLKEKQGFISEDYFTFDEETLTYMITLDGETKTYAPFNVADLGAIEGELVEVVPGINFFKFSKPESDGVNTANFAIRAGTNNSWYMANIDANIETNSNTLVYYTQPSTDPRYLYKALLYKNGDSYSIISPTDSTTITFKESEVEVYNYNNSGTYSYFGKDSSKLEVSALGISIDTYHITEENIIYYDNTKLKVTSKDRNTLITEDGSRYVYLKDFFAQNDQGEYTSFSGFGLVTENSTYKGLFDVTLKEGDTITKFFAGYSYDPYRTPGLVSGDLEVLSINNSSTGQFYRSEYNCYYFNFCYYAYAEGMLFYTRMESDMKNGSFKVLTYGQYEGYTVTRNPDTKEWTLVAPIE